MPVIPVCSFAPGFVVRLIGLIEGATRLHFQDSFVDDSRGNIGLRTDADYLDGIVHLIDLLCG